MKKNYKLVILDRDGVINEDSPLYIKAPNEWHPIPGSLEAIAKLNAAGIKVAVASNQSGIGRGFFNEATLALIHEKMHKELAKVGGHIDKIYYCPHHPDANCNCRKPKPGLLLKILEDFGIPAQETIMIGDSYKDVVAAHAAECAAALVKTGKGAGELHKHHPELTNVPSYDNLAAAIADLLYTDIHGLDFT